ncbi:hypothetical protein FRC02_000882 [Tulasnella sp. 418]|nr:hypothetical protein FRC02_000882 [Tulasnella sp. 418]
MFPLELYQMIIERLDEGKALCYLARTSTAIQMEAERLIYRSIYPHSTVQLCKAAKSILKRPHRHQFVQNLIVDMKQTIGPGWNGIDSPLVAHVTARLLRVTTQLKVLKTSFLPAWVFGLPNHPLLQSLDIQLPPSDVFREKPYEVHLHLLEGYLQRHPNIKNFAFQRPLRWLLPDGQAFVSDNLLPNLDTLFFSGAGSAHLIKDKRLSRFCVLSLGAPIPEIRGLVSYIASMGSSLFVLDLSSASNEWTQALKIQDIEMIASSLPLLRFFGLPIYEDPHSEYDKARDDRLIHILQHHLPELTILALGYKYDRHNVRIFAAECRIVDKLLTGRKPIKWIITTAATRSSITSVRVRDALPEPYCYSKHLDLNSALSDLGVVLYMQSYCGRYLSFS